MSTNKSSGLVQIDCNSSYSICLKETIALLMQIHFVHEFYIYFKETAALLFKWKMFVPRVQKYELLS